MFEVYVVLTPGGIPEKQKTTYTRMGHAVNKADKLVKDTGAYMAEVASDGVVNYQTFLKCDADDRFTVYVKDALGNTKLIKTISGDVGYSRKDLAINLARSALDDDITLSESFVWDNEKRVQVGSYLPQCDSPQCDNTVCAPSTIQELAAALANAPEKKQTKPKANFDTCEDCARVIALCTHSLSQKYDLSIQEMSSICNEIPDFQKKVEAAILGEYLQLSNLIEAQILKSKPNIVPCKTEECKIIDKYHTDVLKKLGGKGVKVPKHVKLKPGQNPRSLVDMKREAEEEPEHEYNIPCGLKLYYTKESIAEAETYYAGLIGTTRENAINPHDESDDPDYFEMICFDLTWRDKLGGYNAAGGRITPSQVISEVKKKFKTKDIHAVAVTPEIL